MTLIIFKGYIEKWRELEEQGLLIDPKSIFVPTGSGGTAAGILIGNYLTGNRHRIFLLQVADTILDLRRDIYEILKDFELDPVAVFKNSEFIEAVGEGNGQKVFSPTLSLTSTAQALTNKLGYAQSTTDELRFCKKIALETGIFLDRVYSGKALKATIAFLQMKMENGWKILDPIFIHTGGIHSIGDSTFSNFIDSSFMS